MTGGIAILVLIIVLLTVGGIALAMYGTGTSPWLRTTDPDRDEPDARREAHSHG